MVASHGRNDPQADESGQDPGFIRQCLQELLASKVEFPIKVEGTHTLPYASQVTALEGEKGLILKLIRPLPHELAAGAIFEMVFSAGDQRYLGLITFRKREAYLTYRFAPPAALVLSDRRRHKRYPFRPREMVDVLGQDGTIPGHGMAGPLINLSLGGLAFRVDRIVKLDDGLRVPATTAFFDQGRSLPLLRIRNLPKVPILEARGTIVHVEEVGGQVQLGVEFGDLTPENGALLRQVIEIRELAFRSNAPAIGSEPRAERPRSGAEEPARTAAAEPAPAAEPERDAPTLRLLQRRCRTLALLADAGAGSLELAERLDRAGYLRTRRFASAADLVASGEAARQRPDALVVGLGGPNGTLQEIRVVQEALGELRRIPALYLAADPDPVASLAEEAGWRLLAMPAGEDSGWIELLDQVAGVE